MIFHKHIPKFPLNKWIDCIIYVEGNNKGVGFPKIAMNLVFNLNDNFKLYKNSAFTDYIDYKKHWVAGFQTGPSYVESYGESKMIVVQFKTTGASVFLQQPLYSFTDNYIPLDCIFNRYADDTWEQLSEAKAINEKIRITEDFLFRNLLVSKMPNEKLLGSIDSLFRNDYNLSVHEICRQHGISRKHLNFLFKENLGVSPKMMSSLKRFQSVLQTISQSKPSKLSDLAYELEYFDQAHFNNNFKLFTGLRPGEYLKNVAVKPTLRFMPHFLPVE